MTGETGTRVLESTDQLEADGFIEREDIRRLRDEMAAFGEELDRLISERADKVE